MSAARECLFQYPSLAVLVNKAINDSSTSPSGDRASRGGGCDGWYGSSWEDAKKIAVKGDVEGARRLSPAMLKAANAMIANKPRLDPVYRLDEGRWIDVARYVKGEPECWGDMVESEPMPRKGLAVVVNVSAFHGISADAIEKCGVAIGSTILGLQTMGYAVTLYATEMINGYGTKWQYLTICAPINAGGAPLDVSQMTVILRPWFLRRILFSLQETYPADIRECFGLESGGGYGRPRSITVEDARRLTGHKNAVIINVETDSKYPNGITDKILNQIKGEY